MLDSCSAVRQYISPHFSIFLQIFPNIMLLLHSDKKNPNMYARTNIHDTTSPCFLFSSDSINGPLGENDSCVRLMSCRPKGASPSTSLGSTLTWLPSAPTKPSDSWYRLFNHAPTNPNDTNDTTSQCLNSGCREWVLSLGARPAVPSNHALGDTVVWRGHREEVEMSRVWVSFNWWVDLNEEWGPGKAGLLKTL